MDLKAISEKFKVSVDLLKDVYNEGYNDGFADARTSIVIEPPYIEEDEEMDDEWEVDLC